MTGLCLALICAQGLCRIRKNRKYSMHILKTNQLTYQTNKLMNFSLSQSYQYSPVYQDWTSFLT